MCRVISATANQKCQPYSYIDIKQTSVPVYEKLQGTYLDDLYTTKWNIPFHPCEIGIDFLTCILNSGNNMVFPSVSGSVQVFSNSL
jgi:hypothetical protein